MKNNIIKFAEYYMAKWFVKNIDKASDKQVLSFYQDQYWNNTFTSKALVEDIAKEVNLPNYTYDMYKSNLRLQPLIRERMVADIKKDCS